MLEVNAMTRTKQTSGGGFVLALVAALGAVGAGCGRDDGAVAARRAAVTGGMTPLQIQGNQFVPALRGEVVCCTPSTGVDLGKRDGWPLVNDPALYRMAAAGVNVTHFRTGPYSPTSPTGSNFYSPDG